MKNLLLAFACTLIHTLCLAQWELSFCKADSLGQCIGKADIFIWNGENTPIWAIVKSAKGFTEGKLQFKIFEIRNDRGEEIYADVKTAVKPEWKSASKKIYFVKPGYYKVEVYDEKMNRLASEFITITDRPQ